MNIDGWIGNQLLDHLSEPLSTYAHGFPVFVGIEYVCQSRTAVFTVRSRFF
jgi:hypothetical protein